MGISNGYYMVGNRDGSLEHKIWGWGLVLQTRVDPGTFMVFFWGGGRQLEKIGKMTSEAIGRAEN